MFCQLGKLSPFEPSWKMTNFPSPLYWRWLSDTPSPDSDLGVNDGKQEGRIQTGLALGQQQWQRFPGAVMTKLLMVSRVQYLRCSWKKWWRQWCHPRMNLGHDFGSSSGRLVSLFLPCLLCLIFQGLGRFCELFLISLTLYCLES